MIPLIVTESGARRYLPAHVDRARVRGLDGEGRIVVEDFEEAPFLFGLTLCCNAYDKGGEDGVYCRKCYGEESGNYLWRNPDGSVPELDPVAATTESTQGNCLYVLDGTDTDGTEWYLCVLHDALAMGYDVQCENA